MIGRLFGRRTPVNKPLRLYAIGDIHGRLDLFRSIIQSIRRDTQERAAMSTKVIILGDFIDRGPESAAIAELLLRLRKEANLIVLKGNHEAAMTDAVDGDFTALDLWIEHGGLATLASFGVPVDTLDLEDTQLILRLAREAIPTPVLSWMRRLPTFAAFDPYYFVHAGIRPGVALAAQTDEDRLWIGDPFIDSIEDHGAVIVHGHSINEAGVAFKGNRIGVDTGAYRTGRLSAVGLEEGDAWVLTAEGSPMPNDGLSVNRDAR